MGKKTSEDNHSNRYHVPSLERALDVLEYLATISDPVSLSTIAAEVGKTPSEVFRIVNCLVNRDYVIRDHRINGYSLSLRLFELSTTVPPVRRLFDAAMAPVADLVNQIRFSCHLSVLEGGHLCIIHEEEGLDAVHVHVRVGSRIPVTETSSGPLLLAHTVSDDAQLQTLLLQDEVYSRRSEAEREAVRRDIMRLQSCRCTVLQSKQHPGVYDVVAVVKYSGGRYVALGVPCFVGNGNPESVHQLKPHVLAAADRIQTALGIPW